MDVTPVTSAVSSQPENAPTPRVSLVTAVCYSQTEDVLLAAYESGLLEIWWHGAVAGRKQVFSISVSPSASVCTSLSVSEVRRYLCICCVYFYVRSPSVFNHCGPSIRPSARWQASDRAITAVCCMPGAQFAVACKRPSVQLWKLVCSPHSGEAR